MIIVIYSYIKYNYCETLFLFFSWLHLGHPLWFKIVLEVEPIALEFDWTVYVIATNHFTK